ncbi:MAG: efflux RND transporter periplasmic adaptor subunit [bacterium]
MRKITKWILWLVIPILIIIIFSGIIYIHQLRKQHVPSEIATNQIYYCPMHPTYTSDKPGQCPICGMDLVLKSESDQPETPMNMAPGTVMISPERQQLIGIKTAEVKRMDLVKTIRAVGKLEYDEQKQVTVTTKIEGWIEKLYVDYTGKLVKKGQPMFTVYSPDLVAAQQEYLLALKSKQYLAESPLKESRESAQTLIDTAKKKLQLWDITDQQIEELEKSGKVTKSITVYAPATGFVVEKMAVQGAKIMPGENIFTLVDLSTIWLIADIYEYELPFIKVGQSAKITFSNLQEKRVTGKVTYIYPALEEETRTVKVRFELSNPSFMLKPGMFANSELQIPYVRKLVIPNSALIDTGIKQLVILAEAEGHFTPKEVKVGIKFDDYNEIISGVSEGDTVVTNANFLIDSESQMKSALSQMGSMPGMPGMANDTSTSEKTDKPPSSMPNMPGM